MTNQFSGEQQYRDLMTVSRPSGFFNIDVEDIDGYSPRCRQGSELAQHFLAKAAPRA
jgi:hypothetical protein